MKLIYVLGLEHSGTTLMDHLLSQQPGVVGLGEVSGFLGTRHMTDYMKKWGHCSDARMCSCGQTWDTCSFWQHNLDLYGLNSDRPIEEKYATLVKRTREQLGHDIVMIDSSKSLATLQMIMSNLEGFGMKPEDLAVVYCCKDVRSFAASIAGKSVQSSLISTLRTFNWWVSANRQILEFLERSAVTSYTSLYENFCRNPESHVARIMGLLGRMENSAVDPLHNRSHIAMGNKNFTMRNRERIAYDTRWFTNDTINLSYLLHFPARALNHRLYSRVTV